MRRQRKSKIEVWKARSNGPRNRKGLDWRKQALDSYDVREWFATDPSSCISDRSAQKILREYEHPYRWWIEFPRKHEKTLIRSRFDKAAPIAVDQRAVRSQNPKRASIEKTVRESAEKHIREIVADIAHGAGKVLIADQFRPWWQSLRNHLNDVLPREAVDRFADYLSGYLVVQENETPRSSATWENKNKKNNNDWRQLKKLLRKLNRGPANAASMLLPSATPPQQEALKTKLIRIMSEELVALDYSRKIIADKFLPFAWDAVGEGILGRSFLRGERRSRHRAARRK